VAIVFFSYSHADEALRDRLEVALAMLKRQGIIETWYDRRIPPGHEFESTIDTHIDQADIVLLLVSPDFLASSYCYNLEVTRAMERHNRGEARVIPVILRPSQWHDASFGKLLALPQDGKPVTKHADLDDAFIDIANGIKEVAIEARGSVPHGPSASPAREMNEADIRLVRSSSLRLKKTFTQADTDQFLDDTFEYIAQFFESSIGELGRRNPGIQGRFRRLDANTFTAVAYRDGHALARCKITLGGMLGKGISYSNDDSSLSNSFNENLGTMQGDQGLGLQLCFGNFGNASKSQLLTAEGAAEAYWARFMEPLQR
jgi:TIR domain